MQVTVSSRALSDDHERARSISEIPGFKFLKRGDVDWGHPTLQVSRNGLVLKKDGQEYRWHPGLLHTRLEAGWTHPLVRSMALCPGDRVLDCTLGMGIDAAFLAVLTGVPVVALEIQPALALLCSEGLRRAGHLVQVACADARSFIKILPDSSFDVVQGDPMFPEGTGVTRSLDVIRHVGCYEPLGMTWLAEARRVARKRVVVRDIAHGTLLERMEPDEIMNVGRGRPRYGIWYGSS